MVYCTRGYTWYLLASITLVYCLHPHTCVRFLGLLGHLLRHYMVLLARREQPVLKSFSLTFTRVLLVYLNSKVGLGRLLYLPSTPPWNHAPKKQKQKHQQSKQKNFSKLASVRPTLDWQSRTEWYKYTSARPYPAPVKIVRQKVNYDRYYTEDNKCYLRSQTVIGILWAASAITETNKNFQVTI